MNFWQSCRFAEKQEDVFISSLCCLTIPREIVRGEKGLKSLHFSTVQKQPFNNCYNPTFESAAYFKYDQSEEIHSGFSVPTDLGQAWLLNWEENILSYIVFAGE